MDTPATLLGLGLLMAFIAPIGYLVIDQSRREKARKKKLFTTAARFDLQISETYIVNGLSLGLDQQQRKLLVFESSNSYEPKVVNIDKSKVQLIKKFNNKTASGTVDDINEISLRIESPEKTETVSFFRRDVDPVTETGRRLQKALDWEKILTQQK